MLPALGTSSPFRSVQKPPEMETNTPSRWTHPSLNCEQETHLERCFGKLGDDGSQWIGEESGCSYGIRCGYGERLEG